MAKSKGRFFRWVVEIEVDELWVEDGFNLNDEGLRYMLEHRLPWAYGHEFRGRVIAAPDPIAVRIVQGAEVDGKRRSDEEIDAWSEAHHELRGYQAEVQGGH